MLFVVYVKSGSSYIIYGGAMLTVPQVAEQRGISIQQLLKEEYRKHQSQRAVARAINVKQSNVAHWIKRSGLRTISLLIEAGQDCDC
jgi:hypothetical protein